MSYDVPEIRDLSSEEHYAMEREFAEWFEDRRCGHACKVFVVPHADGTQLIIRRGEPMRREESLEDNDFGSVFYRPLKYDVLMFHRVTGELSIHADSSAQKAIYCRMVGKYFFGNENLFPPSTRYTLAPLANYGPTALSCGDIEELISVKLVEIQILIGGSQREILIHKARDVFEAFEDSSRLGRDLRAAQTQIRGFGDSVRNIGLQLGTIFSGVALSSGILNSAKSFADAGSALDDLSQRSGASVESLGALSLAAKLTKERQMPMATPSLVGKTLSSLAKNSVETVSRRSRSSVRR